jgi:hypothetical protein
VPKGQVRTEANRTLADRAQPVFEEHPKRRGRYIRDDSGADVSSLVREWFDDGNSDVRPSNAWLGYRKTAKTRCMGKINAFF